MLAAARSGEAAARLRPALAAPALGRAEAAHRRRARLRRAARVIIADEPMSALDVSVQAAISELLMNLQRESKTTMVFISHDLSVVRYLADRVVVMYLGHIVEMGATEQIFSPPFHPYTEALLSAIPIADPSGEEAARRARGRDSVRAVAADRLPVPDALRPQGGRARRTCASGRFRRCGAWPTATRSSATCRSRRSSAWSRCFREGSDPSLRGAKR